MSIFTIAKKRTYPKAMLVTAILCFGSLPVLAKGLQHFDFSNEMPGTEAKSFSSLIGNWHIDRDGSRSVYAVDGRNWEQGVMAPAAGAKARALYGESSTGFLHNLEAYRYSPLSVFKEVKTFQEEPLKPPSNR
ncbi:hypothetical protein [Geomonas subterranea]|uniref:hypothetical protein n=1 Tax=Geomonas subterranea TaxID=2847989 RepID=UPI001CD37FC0|nr:hypothetical protein [Geomonas fuzhouensis]